jgi:uncharacterized membrane protein/mono/diheme cytochrome c family protein
MPSFRGKISEDQTRELVAHVRRFAPKTHKPGPEKQQDPSPSDFEKEFRSLQKEMDELTRLSRELSEGKPDRERSKPSEFSPRAVISKPSNLAAAEAPADRELFRQHCVKCHEADGTGSQVRRRRPEIPNLTDTAWHALRSDAQLLASILDGKGKEMPPWRGKLSEEHARGLVAYVRAFAPPTETARQEEQEDPTHDEPEEAKPPEGCFEKLIPWLGRFHQPAVHFPIALLTAAALAELLGLVTGQPAFDAVSRYCIWFGAFSAAGAGVLGWCRADFRLTDVSWIMMTHRWLGTSTVACAAVALVLGEGSRRPGRRRIRMWFRAALLVVAALVLITGFFGGAVVFGLDHYTWPQ